MNLTHLVFLSTGAMKNRVVAPFLKTVKIKKMKLKIWWIPNPPRQSFEMRVLSFAQAYIALEVLSYLDLENSNLLRNQLNENFGDKKELIGTIEHKYRSYRRVHEINGAWLIYSNVGGLLVYNEDLEEWEDWASEDGEDFNAYLEYQKQDGKDIKDILAELDNVK